jgi:hypothetical protein
VGWGGWQGRGRGGKGVWGECVELRLNPHTLEPARYGTDPARLLQPGLEGDRPLSCRHMRMSTATAGSGLAWDAEQPLQSCCCQAAVNVLQIKKKKKKKKIIIIIIIIIIIKKNIRRNKYLIKYQLLNIKLIK